MGKDLFVYLVGMLNEIICSIASFQLRRNEMEKSNEADLERISWRSLQLCENQPENSVKVRVKGRS